MLNRTISIICASVFVIISYQTNNVLANHDGLENSARYQDLVSEVGYLNNIQGTEKQKRRVEFAKKITRLTGRWLPGQEPQSNSPAFLTCPYLTYGLATEGALDLFLKPNFLKGEGCTGWVANTEIKQMSKAIRDLNSK